MEPPRRITLLIPALVAGGAERVMSTLANAWVARGRHIRLLTLADPSVSPFYPLDPRIQVIQLGLAKPSHNLLQALVNNARRLLVLRRAVQAGSPEVVVTFVNHANVLGLLATFGLPVPVIVSERSDPYEEPLGPVWKLMRRIIYRRAAAIVVQTEQVRSYFAKGIQKRVHVIPNPAPKLDPVTAIARPVNGSKVVMAMGRLTRSKGFDLLFRAFAQVADQSRDWSLEIWGQGELRDQLQALASSLCLSGRVRFRGVTEQPVSEMQQADLFVLSSRYEGFPNVLIEAMAAGLPVISFDCPSGPREIIRPGVDGILVPPGDVAALASEMAEVMADEERRRHLGTRAREIVERFSQERILGEWEALMEAVTAAQGKP